MTRPVPHAVRFSVTQWQHLYALHQAISQAELLQAHKLDVSGTLRNHVLFDNRDTAIALRFYQVDGVPDYRRDEQGRMILGQLDMTETGLYAELPVDARVFEELRKNLVEYADIDGIHIMVNIGLLLEERHWPADILTLEYAMRGDA